MENKNGLKNTLGDLNRYLFEQMDALSNQDIKGEDLQEAINRSKAIGSIAKDIVSNASLVLEAKKISANAMDANFKAPEMLEG